VSTFLLLVRIPSTRSSLSRRGGGEGHVHNYNFHNYNFYYSTIPLPSTC